MARDILQQQPRAAINDHVTTGGIRSVGDAMKSINEVIVNGALIRTV